MGGAPAGAPPAEQTIPDKYLVKDAAGAVDYKASALKVAASNGELEKRMKDIGLPPESADKYEVAAADAADKELFDTLAKDPVAQDFLKQAHALGYSNKQANLALNFYLGMAKDLAESTNAATVTECMGELKAFAKTDAAVTELLSTGHRATLAMGAIAGIPFAEIEKAGLANNPLFCRIMATVGKQMGEDLPPIEGAGGGEGKGFEVEVSELRAELEKMEIYDPKRKEVQARLDKLYERKYPKTKPVLQGAA